MSPPETTELTTSQILPQAEEAELALLGAILVNNECIHDVSSFLKADHFYAQKHQVLFNLISELYDKHHAVDITMLATEIKRQKKSDLLPPSYIAGLEQWVKTTTNVEHYGRQIVDKARIRMLIQAVRTIHQQAVDETLPADELLNESERQIFEIIDEKREGEFQALAALAPDVISEIEHRYINRGEVHGVRTHYKRLDEFTGGLQKSDFIIVAGRPSSGKTAFALSMALNIVWREQRPVGFFSLEMSSAQLVQRLLSMYARVSADKLRTGQMKANEQKLLTEANKRLSQYPLHIDDTPGLKILELRARARRLKNKVPDLCAIFVDYLQLIQTSRPDRGDYNRQVEVSEISRTLKSIARELQIPVIALSQLNRLIERRKGKDSRPKCSDLRESGALEQDSDVILFIHRDMKEQQEIDKDPLKKKQGLYSEVVIGKQRNGPLGIVPLLFFPDHTSFQDPPKNFELKYDM